MDQLIRDLFHEMLKKSLKIPKGIKISITQFGDQTYI